MEKKCVDDVELITTNRTHKPAIEISSFESSAATVVSPLSEFSLLAFYRQLFGSNDFNNRPSTSHNSMSSILQEFGTNSEHNFAVVLDDETTTSGVLEAFEIGSSNSLPTCTTTTSASTDSGSGAVQDDNSSTDTTIEMLNVTSEPSPVTNNNQCISKFFKTAKVFVINGDTGSATDIDVDIDPECGDDEDDGDEDPDGGVECDIEANVNIIGGDDDDVSEIAHDVEVVVERIDNANGILHNTITQRDNVEILNENTLADRSRHDDVDAINGVLVSTNTGVIYIETPVVEEQHHEIPTELETDGFRHCTEYSMKSSECSKIISTKTDNPTSSSMNLINRVNINIDKRNMHNKIHDGLSLSQEICSIYSERISSRSENVNLNNNCTQDIPLKNSKTMPMLVSEIKSIDQIERHDFEHEQRLTGGILLKSNSFINNDTLNLGFIKTHLDKKNTDIQVTTSNKDNWPDSSNNANKCRPFFSDSKCTYQDYLTTPTSSRRFNSRLIKSTAKINLGTFLSQHNVQQQMLQQSHKYHEQQRTPTRCILSTKRNITPTTYSIASSVSTCMSHSKNKVKTKSSDVVNEIPTTSEASAHVEISNESVFRNASSTTSSIATSSMIVKFASSVSGASTLISALESKGNNCGREISQQQNINNVTTVMSSVVVCVTDNGCSRTSPVHSILTSNVTHNNTSSKGTHDDDVQPSSSGRCQFGTTLKTQRQVHASAQTNDRYLYRSSVGKIPIGVNLSLSNRNRRRVDMLANHSLDFFNIADDRQIASQLNRHNNNNSLIYSHEASWIDCEDNHSDIEEICTCHPSASGNSSHGNSRSSLNDIDDIDTMDTSNKDNGDLSNYIMHNLSISEEANASSELKVSRKRKYNDSRLIDHDYNSVPMTNTDYGLNGKVGIVNNNSRKRIAYDFASSPRSTLNNSVTLTTVSTSSPPVYMSTSTVGSSYGRLASRCLIPNRDSLSYEIQQWISQFKNWDNSERLLAVDRLIESCEPTQVRHMMKVIEPQFQRDFISLLPRELALQVLSNLDPKDLLKAAQTCRSWRFLCDDNLLWKEKCRDAQILTESHTDKPKRGRAGNMPYISSPWKAAYMRQHIIETNWRLRPIRQPKVLKGHDEHVITCLQFSGNRIVSGSDDNTLKVWSAVTGRCLRTLVGHTGGVWSSQLSGNIIISGSTDRTLKVWDMESGQCVHTLLGHTSTVRCMHLHGKKVVSGSRDATLRVWDIQHGTCMRVLVGHLAAVRCVQYDGKLIVSGAYDYMVKIWHPDRSECLHTLQGHTNRVYSLQFDGIHVVSGSLDTSIRVWDVETGNCKHTLMGHQSLTSGMELRENILVSGNADSTVKVWDISTGQCLQTLSGPNKHQSAVTCLQFNSRFVVTSSDDGTVKLWDVKTGEFIRNLVTLESGGSGGVVWRIRANDTKLICAVGSRNGTEETKLMVLDFDVEGACVKCS